MSRFLSVYGIVSVDAMKRTERDSTAFTLVGQVICSKKQNKNTDQSATSVPLPTRLRRQRSHKTNLSYYNRKILVIDHHWRSYNVTILNLPKMENVLFFIIFFFILYFLTWTIKVDFNNRHGLIRSLTCVPIHVNF